MRNYQGYEELAEQAPLIQSQPLVREWSLIKLGRYDLKVIVNTNIKLGS